MKKTKLTVFNSLLAGILICGILAAYGAFEKRLAAPKIQTPDVLPVSAYVPDHVVSGDPASKDADNTEDTPDTDSSENAEPDTLTETEKTVADRVIDTARELLGTKYASNRCTPEEGFDSSGFAMYCLNQNGVEFPRRIKEQINAGEQVGYSELKTGDVVFFSAEEGGKANFCGIYAGGGLIIYSPAPGGSVKTANITTSYWTARFVCGVRVIN